MDLNIKKEIENTLKEKIQNYKTTKLIKFLQNLKRDNLDKKSFIWTGENPRIPFKLPYLYEYVKISEGCDNRCSFCIIPKIRGNQKSRQIDDILEEIKNLVSLGVKEIEIISQDTTRYGFDLGGKSLLFDLLEKIENLDLDFKFRLFYLYPDTLTLENLKKLKNFKKFIHYFDLPFQHINQKILKKMGRFYDDNHIKNLLDFIKKEFKDAFIHTNFIVGFPGEQEEEFLDLVEFAEKYRFDSVSMFGYHDEKLAASSRLPEKNSDKVIQQRVKKLKKVLEGIYKEKEKERKGKDFVGYVEDFDNEFAFVRWEFKAPELDELDKIYLKDIRFGNLGIGEKVRYIKS